MHDSCRKEVVELHEFFEGWLGGMLARTPENFRRFSGVLAEDFEIIHPRGARSARRDLVAGLRQSHGAHADADRPFGIRIENYRGRPLGKDVYLATYEEWQDIRGETRGRLSTALFRRRADTPNGVEWVHVHETWLPEGAHVSTDTGS